MSTEHQRMLARNRQRKHRAKGRTEAALAAVAEPYAPLYVEPVQSVPLLYSELQPRLREVRPAQREANDTRDAPLQQSAVILPVVKGPSHGLKIAVITDAQVKPGVPIDHLVAAGRYLADKRPDVIIGIGDFADMPSLSTWNKPGVLEGEGLRYKDDVKAVREAMAAFLKPIRAVKGYNPELVLTLGNHEDRITRAVNENPKQLAGVMSIDDLGYGEAGWTVVPFLQPIVIGGVAFAHYFPSGVMGKPITSARALLTKMHMSCFAGHLQGRDIAYGKRADGASMTAIISGSFYQHDESYLSPFTNKHWRGMYMLHEVKDGEFDEMAVSIDFLKRRLG